MNDDESPQASVLSSIKERLAHPVIGVFITAWVLCNWKAIFYLFADKGPAKERIVAAVAYSDFVTMASWPLLATFLYVFLAPILRAGASWWNDWVSGKEAERVYQARLLEIQRQADVAQKLLASREPAIEQQQQRFNILEAQVKAKANEKVTLDNAVSELLEISGPAWTPIFPLPSGAPAVDKMVRQEVLNQLKPRFERIEELRKQLFKEAR